jgi:hypothetical protein
VHSYLDDLTPGNRAVRECAATVHERLASPCHAMPCHAMPCHAMPCLALPCLALPCPPICSCTCSRNARLSDSARKDAVAISAALRAAAAAYPGASAAQVVADVAAAIQGAGGRVDYVEVDGWARA